MMFNRIHTSKLVEPGTLVNKKTCLALGASRRDIQRAMTVAANLKRLRLDRNLSQGKLAELANVSQQLVSQIERGENVSTKYLPQIAKALRCEVGEIDPSYRVGEAPQDQLLREIVALVEQLSEQERRLLLGAAQGLISADKPEG